MNRKKQLKMKYKSIYLLSLCSSKKKGKKDMSKITFDRKFNRAFRERKMINEI